MATVYDGIDAELAAWIERQPAFLVATAPLAADGLVNVSPKGEAGTFRVVDDHTFAYLDLSGSGIETVAHLRENGTRDEGRIAAYDTAKNATSLDGLPGLTAAGQL
jgi:hypothetical protein